MPLSGYKSKMHYRNLLYTAVTRAKSRLIILGQENTIAAHDRKRPQNSALYQPQGAAAGRGRGSIKSAKGVAKKGFFPL